MCLLVSDKTSTLPNGNFATQKSLICVKEFAYGSPKFFPTEKTFLNNNIKSNLNGGLSAEFNK